MSPRVRRRLRAGVSRQNVQNPRPERAVLILLAPYARGQIHERRERAVSAAERPYAHVRVRVERYRLPYQADGGGSVARFLNRRLQPPAARIRHRVERVPDRAVFDVDGFGEVRRHHDEAVVRDVIRPLDDFRDCPPRAANVSRLLEQLDGQVLRLAGRRVGHFRILRLRRQVLDLQARIGERVFGAVDAERQVVVHAVANVGEAVGYPVSKPVPVENGHGDVHVALELDEALAVVRNRAVPDAFELHPEALLERAGERREVVAVHGEVVRVAVVAHHLISEAGDFAVHRAGPPALDGLAHDYHRAVVFAVPVLHRLEGGDDLIVVVAVVQRHHVPAVSRPLVFDAIGVVNGAYDAADELVVYARVVVREQDSQPLADLLGDRRSFHFLRVSRRHGEFAFDGDDFQAVGRAHDVPERRLARGRGDADARRPAVHVVGQVGRLGVSGERAYAAQLRLRHEGVVGQAAVAQQGIERLAPSAEAERVYGEHRRSRVGGVSVVAGERVLARERLAHDHPQRVGDGGVVAAGEHESVGVGVFRAAVVVAQPAQLRPYQVRRDGVGRIGERAAEVSRLRVVAQENQRHRREKAHVLDALPVIIRQLHHPRRHPLREGEGVNRRRRASICLCHVTRSAAISFGRFASERRPRPTAVGARNLNDKRNRRSLATFSPAGAAFSNFSRDGESGSGAKIAAEFGKFAQIRPKFHLKRLALSIYYMILLIQVNDNSPRTDANGDETMTLLILNLNNRIGQLALAAALAIGAIALSAPAVSEAAGGVQTTGASEDFVFLLLAFGLSCIVAGTTLVGDALSGLVTLAGL